MEMFRALRSRKRERTVRQAAAVAVLSDRTLSCEETAGDWAGEWRSLTLLWGLPGAAMLAAAFIRPELRGIVWTIMLLWMGGVCLANARRCSRTHCRFTGPFLLVMAGGVAAYALGILGLGPRGLLILGGIAVAGFAVIWWTSERIWGTFSR